LIWLTGHVVTFFSSNSPGKSAQRGQSKRSDFTDKLKKSGTTGPCNEIKGLARDRNVTGHDRV
jgi:hypothetical protein